MDIVFANNQTIVAENGTAVVITTDPVPMGDMDRISGTLVVHGVAGPARIFAADSQVSNDGIGWTTAGIALSATGITTDPVINDGDLPFAFVRFRFTLTVTGGAPGDIGAIVFDVHGRLLKA